MHVVSGIFVVMALAPHSAGAGAVAETGWCAGAQETEAQQSGTSG